MFATTSAIKTFISSIEVNVKNLSEADSKKALVMTAVHERERVINLTKKRSGFEPLYRQIVDGREGAPLEAVKPNGKIIFAWQYAVEVATDTLSALVNRSPYDEGHYISGLIVLLDGKEGLLSQVNVSTKLIQIVASVPYARRLEVGKRDDGSPFVLQVKPHIVEETAIVARKLYNKLAEITFGYMDLTDAYRLGPMGRRKRHLRKNGTWYTSPTLRKETHVRYPVISIRPRVA